jgi:diacylglycerol kinase (ATP)
MPKQIILITNPRSGSYSQARLNAVITALESQGTVCRVKEAETPEAAAECAKEACRIEREPFLVVAAGDGTINGVANGLDPGKATLGVIPFGTSNVLALELGIKSTAQAIDRIKAGIVRPISAGIIDKDSEKRVFLLMAGVGFDGYVVKGVRPVEKKRLGKGAFILSALRTLLSWERDIFDVESGGKTYRCHSVIICNASKYGGAIAMAPTANLFEPGFDVICIGDHSRNSYLRIACRLLMGKKIVSRTVSRIHSMELNIRGSKALQADGDFYFHAPVRIRTLPDFVKIIV